MDKKQIESKKESAKALYLTAQYTQEEISNMVGISRVSLTKWIKKGSWEELRRSITLTPEKMISHLNKQLDEINNNILAREHGKRFATSKEADAILKISKTIRNLQRELGLCDIISFSMKFLTWLHGAGEYEKGKEFLPLFNAFIYDISGQKNTD